MLRFVAVLALAAVITGTASAQSSLIDKDRLAFGAGASYDWHRGNPTPELQQKDEVCANLFGAYSLTEHISAVARATYGAGNRALRVSPGAHYSVPLGGESFAVALTYDFYAGGYLPSFPNEWVASAIYARKVGSLTAAVVASRLFDNNEYRYSVQLTVPIWVGAEDN